MNELAEAIRSSARAAHDTPQERRAGLFLAYLSGHVRGLAMIDSATKRYPSPELIAAEQALTALFDRVTSDSQAPVTEQPNSREANVD